MGKGFAALGNFRCVDCRLIDLTEDPEEATEQMRGVAERTMVLELGQGSETASAAFAEYTGTRASQGWGWAPQGWGTKVGFSGLGHKSGASQGWDEKGAVRVATKTKGFARAQRRARVRLARRSAE